MRPYASSPRTAQRYQKHLDCSLGIAEQQNTSAYAFSCSLGFPDDVAFAIQIGDFQTDHLRYAESRAIHRRENHPVPEVRRRFEQRLDFALAQNDGQLLLIAGQGNPVDLDLPV